MTDYAFVIGQGDLRPRLTATLYGPDGAVVDLTGVPPGAVTLHLEHGTGWLVGGAAEVVNAPAGQVAYDWKAGDTDVPGYYRGQWRIAWPSGAESYPNDGNFLLLVSRSIA